MEIDKLENEIYDRLGICGCGMPEEAVIFLDSFINWVQDTTESGLSDVENSADFVRIIKDHFWGLLYLLYYYLDDKQIFEHGSSVPGWVPDIQFIEKLNRYRQTLEQDSDK